MFCRTALGCSPDSAELGSSPDSAELGSSPDSAELGSAVGFAHLRTGLAEADVDGSSCLTTIILGSSGLLL